MNTKSFIFNLEWYSILSEYPSEIRFEVYEAIMTYAASGSQPELTGSAAKMAFSFIKKELDYNRERYEAVVERNRENGRKGGAPKGNRNAAKRIVAEYPIQPEYTKTTKICEKQPIQPESTETTLNDNDNDNDNVNDIIKKDKGKRGVCVRENIIPIEESDPEVADREESDREESDREKSDPEKSDPEEAALEKEFEAFRKAYPGSKRGLAVEFGNFRKKYPRDWKEIVPLLRPALERLLAHHRGAEEANRRGAKIFIPNFAYLSTWLNNARWEEELPDIAIPERCAPPAPAKSVRVNQPCDFGGRQY